MNRSTTAAGVGRSTADLAIGCSNDGGGRFLLAEAASVRVEIGGDRLDHGRQDRGAVARPSW